MSYTALYRKWRPLRFEEVRGQDPIVRTLKNQIKSDRIGHAYLFCGTRGTGKTTMAKIFARAVNCEHPVDGSPCNECPTCKSILAGNSVNVVEIDAASNNGVDNIRQIREEVKYKPTEGKYRVYIIDEVHMLSTGAFNALLKTLEEPPEYVIFILATTEVHKIPITVLSRCQRYDVKRLTLKEIENQIATLLKEEKVEAEPQAISYIARTADGSSRDALSLLEQCISYYYGETLTYERVLDVLGAVDQTIFSKMFHAIIHYDIPAAVALIDELLGAGRDLMQFVTDFIWYLRNVLLIQTENPGEEVLGISKENLERMKEEAQSADINQIMRYIRILSALSNEMRYASSKRVLLEIAIMKMMQPEMEENLDSVLDRIRVLEENAGTYVERPKTESTDSTSEKKTEEIEARVVEISQATYDDYQLLSKDWKDVLESEGRLFRSVFSGTMISANEQTLQVVFKDPYYFSVAENTHQLDVLKEHLQKRYGKEFQIKLNCLKKNEVAPKIVLNNRIPGIDMEIEQE